MRFLLVLALFKSLAAFAHVPKDGDIHSSIGGFLYTTHNLHHNFDAPLLLGPALSVEADVNRHGGLEVGIFYLQNPFAIRQNGHLLVEKVKRMMVTTGYRHWFDPNWSVALAFSSSYAIGDPVVLHDDFGAVDHVSSSAEDITEYGFDGSLQYEAFRHERASLVFDLRYDYSVTPKPFEDSNHYGIFIAFKYFVQARQRAPGSDPD